MTRRMLGGLCVLALCAPVAAQDPAVDQVVDLAGKYVVRYAEALPLLVAAENYSQWSESMDEGGRPWHRTLLDEFALVRLASGDDWTVYRDTYQVDNKRVSSATDRLQRALKAGDAAGIAEARRLSSESATYNMAPMGKGFNKPTMALFFLRPANKARYTFKKGGEASVNGIATWKIDFMETQKPTLFRSPTGNDLPIRGSFWINPEDGRVLRTQMEMEIQAATGVARNDTWASIRVTYKPDGADGVLLPSEMLENYEYLKVSTVGGKDARMRVNCVATYSGYQRAARQAPAP